MTQNPPEHSDPQAPAPPPDSSPPDQSLAQGVASAAPQGQPAWVPPGPWPAQGQLQQGGSPGWQPAAAGPVPAPPGWVGPAMRQHWPVPVRPVAYPAPARFEQVPGEGFGLAILPAPRTVSGVAVGSLVAGIGSILVSSAVWCFGLAGADGGWGGLVGGAFFVLAALLGVAAVALGGMSLRQIRRGADLGVTGRGYGISGIACGGFGLLSAGLALVLAIQLSGS